MIDEIRALARGERGVWTAWGMHLLGLAPVVAWLWWTGFATLPYLLAVYLSFSALMIRTFLEHQAAEDPEARTVIIERGGPFALLFLNNNLHAVHHDRPAVAVQFEDVLPGKRAWRREIERDADVDREAAGAREHGDRRVAGLGEAPQDRGRDRARQRAGDAHHPDASAARRRRGSHDGLGRRGQGRAVASSARPSSPGCGCMIRKQGISRSHAAYCPLSSKARRKASTSNRPVQRGRMPPAR